MSKPDAPPSIQVYVQSRREGQLPQRMPALPATSLAPQAAVAPEAVRARATGFRREAGHCPACYIDRAVEVKLTWELLSGSNSLYCWRCEAVFAVE